MSMSPRARLQRVRALRHYVPPEPPEESDADRADRLEHEAADLIDVLRNPNDTLERIRQMLDEVARLRGQAPEKDA